jgi:DNA-directed RNA polymerase subunit RPC12/RpoP
MSDLQSEPHFVICPCQHCEGRIEFDASQAGAGIACPHCGLATLLFVPPTDSVPPVIAPPAQTPSAPEPIWFGSKTSVVEVRLTSGAIIKFNEVRLYDAAELNELSAQKSYAAELLDGSKSPYAPFGGVAWVLVMSKILSIAEQAKSREMAQSGVALIQKIAARERKLRADVKFFHVGQIQEIENPNPTLWTLLFGGLRFVHSEEDFITVKETDAAFKRFRWSCVESYGYYE